MKRTILLNTSIVVVLLSVSIIPTVQPLPSRADPPLPTSPTPTPPPVEPQIGHPTYTPPSPVTLPPDVEESHARQAIEAALAKYLRYWGPRYQVAPIEIAMEGEWAHGVAQWRSATRTLSGPIHILAHRLPDGTWQALMPGSDGLYLQWLEAVPENLVPVGEKGQLRTQAAETDALRRPRSTPPVSLAATAMTPGEEGPSGPVELIQGQAQPTATPTSEAIVLTLEGKAEDILSDGQFVFGPNVGGFNISTYLYDIGSPLYEYADVIERWCAYASVNPRVVLTLIEMRSGLVRRHHKGDLANPIGYSKSGFEEQVRTLIIDMATNFYEHLYSYGSRSKKPSIFRGGIRVNLADGSVAILPGNIQSGSYAILRTLAPISTKEELSRLMSVSEPLGFVATYRELFPGDNPLDKSNQINPMSPPPADLLQLPFPTGSSWWFNGPHNWNGAGFGPPYSSMDFGTSANNCGSPQICGRGWGKFPCLTMTCKRKFSNTW